MLKVGMTRSTVDASSGGVASDRPARAEMRRGCGGATSAADGHMQGARSDKRVKVETTGQRLCGAQSIQLLDMNDLKF